LQIDLHNGDCLELMKDIPDGSVDLILCDLPYGTTACKWDTIIPFEPLWEQYNRIIKDNGAIVLFGSEPFSSKLRMSNIKNYKYDWIWEKEQGVNQFLCKKQPLRKTENISIFYKNQTTYNPQFSQGLPYENNRVLGCECFGTPRKIKTKNNGYRYPVNILKYPRELKNRYHPTQKPVDLLEYLVKTYTNENETVLDNCMGSGSTGVACINTGRNFIGIELDEGYFKIAQKRIQAAQAAK
jgi:DNA modification methylase